MKIIVNREESRFMLDLSQVIHAKIRSDRCVNLPEQELLLWFTPPFSEENAIVFKGREAILLWHELQTKAITINQQPQEKKGSKQYAKTN